MSRPQRVTPILTKEEQDLVDELVDHRNAIKRYENAVEKLRPRRDELIRQLREDHGWTGRDIEPYAGVSNVYVYRLVGRV